MAENEKKKKPDSIKDANESTSPAQESRAPIEPDEEGVLFKFRISYMILTKL
jgi:hypothetical protein